MTTTTKEYKPTNERVCEVHGCEGFGKPLVDRGYGFPVCETVRWRDESVFTPMPRIPMSPKYLND